MAVLYSLYYAVSRRSPLWWHGVTFVALYMAFLVWQTYYALLTIRNTAWGTRASTHGPPAAQSPSSARTPHEPTP